MNQLRKPITIRILVAILRALFDSNIGELWLRSANHGEVKQVAPRQTPWWWLACTQCDTEHPDDWP